MKEVLFPTIELLNPETLRKDAVSRSILHGRCPADHDVGICKRGDKWLRLVLFRLGVDPGFHIDRHALAIETLSKYPEAIAVLSE